MIVWPVTSSSRITEKSRIVLTIGGQFQTTLSGVRTMKTTRMTTWNRKQPRPGPRSGLEVVALVLDRAGGRARAAGRGRVGLAGRSAARRAGRRAGRSRGGTIREVAVGRSRRPASRAGRSPRGRRRRRRPRRRPDEPAVLDDPLRPDVVERDVREDRPVRDLLEQEPQRGRRDSRDPSTRARSSSRPRDRRRAIQLTMSSDRPDAVRHDRPGDAGRVGPDRRPVLVEGVGRRVGKAAIAAATGSSWWARKIGRSASSTGRRRDRPAVCHSAGRGSVARPSTTSTPAAPAGSPAPRRPSTSATRRPGRCARGPSPGSRPRSASRPAARRRSPRRSASRSGRRSPRPARTTPCASRAGRARSG